MTPAVIYVRVSTEMQAERGGGIDDQLQQCLQTCERNGYDILGVFKDEAFSGRIEDRPSFQQALAAVPPGGVLVCPQWNRLSRDAAYRLELPEELASRGVVINSSTQGIYDPANDGQWLAYGVEAIFSEYLPRLISKHTIEAFRRHRREGRQHGGRPPYGYVWGEAGRLVPDPVQEAVVGDIFTWAEQGHGKGAIAKRLTDAGVRRPDGKDKPWTDATVKHILANVALAGRVAHRYEKKARGRGRKPVWKRLPRDKWLIYAGQHPAIIEPARFDSVQQLLQARSWRVPRNYGHEFLLTGLLRCPYCGGKMHGAHQKTQSRRYPTYRCTTFATTRTCRAVARGAEKWEKRFLELVDSILQNVEASRPLWEYGAAPSQRPEEARIRAELAEIPDRRAALYDAVETRAFSMTAIQTRLQRLTDRERELSQQQEALVAASKEPGPPTELQSVYDLLHSSRCSMAQKRAALASVIDAVLWADDGDLRLVFRTE